MSETNKDQKEVQRYFVAFWTKYRLIGDWKKIIETATKHGKAIELNSNPHRLDIDWRVLREFRKAKNLKIAISPDAHSTLGLEDLKWGLGIARKGGLKKSQLLTADDLS